MHTNTSKPLSIFPRQPLPVVHVPVRHPRLFPEPDDFPDAVVRSLLVLCLLVALLLCGLRGGSTNVPDTRPAALSAPASVNARCCALGIVRISQSTVAGVRSGMPAAPATAPWTSPSVDVRS